ncbi:hypothetical protein, partial [Uruburuella suis]|uniref:hypothetical protein n=1 Tax=Uruburuella suis TaxID=252130 RepID=UPI00249037B7
MSDTSVRAASHRVCLFEQQQQGRLKGKHLHCAGVFLSDGLQLFYYNPRVCSQLLVITLNKKESRC